MQVFSRFLRFQKNLLFLLFLTITITAFGEPTVENNHHEEPYKGWRKTETEHFTFIYEPKDEGSVAELLTFCEDSYQKVADYFGFSPEHINCIVNGRIDTANGYFSALPNRIVLYITSPSGPWLGAKTENLLELLLIHELVHYIHMNYNKGFLYGLSRVFGYELRVAAGGFLPGWMIEGIAVALETDYTGGGRGRNPFFELYWKAQVIEGELFSLRQASYSSPFPPPGRIYYAGYIISDYMMNRFGADVFKRIHDRFVKFPFFGPRRAIRVVTGETAEEIYNGMVDELEARYASSKEIQDGSLVTAEAVGNYYFPKITDRGWYLYRSGPNGPSAIVRFNPDTGKEKLILRTSLTDPDSFSAVPDGSLIVYTSFRADGRHPAGRTLTSDLYTFDTENRRPRRITTDRHLRHPAAAPDEKTAAAVQIKGQYSRLVKVDMDDGSISELFSLPETNVYTPSFSPSGDRLVFTLNDHGTQDVWMYDFKTGKAAPLFGRDKHGEYYPLFVDDERITFSSDRTGSLALYTAQITGGAKQGGTGNESGKGDPVPSIIRRDPVGAYIGMPVNGTLYFGSYRSDGWCIKSAPFREKKETAFWKSVEIPEDGFPTGDENGGTETAGTVESARYFDIAKPLLWAPVPLYISSFQSLPPVFGLGVFAYGASPLEKSDWTAAVTSRLDVFQPGVYFRGNFSIRSLRLFYNLDQLYYQQARDLYTQRTDQSFGVRIPVFLRTSYAKARSAGLSLATGLSHSFILQKDAPFHFFNGFDLTSGSFGHSLYAYGSAGFSVSRFGSARQIYSPFDLYVSSSITVPIPLYPSAPRGFVFDSTFEFQFPTFFRYQFLKLGIKNNYTGSAFLGGRRISPRGIFDPEPQPSEGMSLFAVDYLAALGIMDVPLPLGYNMFGFHLRGIALGVHGEWMADWSPSGGTFEMDDYIYTGIELVFIVGQSLASVPLGFGVSFRFDRSLAVPVDITRDLRPYLFIGLDSFISTVMERAGEGRGGPSSVTWGRARRP